MPGLMRISNSVRTTVCKTAEVKITYSLKHFLSKEAGKAIASKYRETSYFTFTFGRDLLAYSVSR